MPRDTSQDEVVVEHPSHSAILVMLAYIPAWTFNFRVPATRGEAVEMIRRQLQAADPELNIYNSTPGKDAFLHLVGNPAGKDHARCPLFASCWMVNNPTLRDFILRKRELLFAGGSLVARRRSRSASLTCRPTRPAGGSWAFTLSLRAVSTYSLISCTSGLYAI